MTTTSYLLDNLSPETGGRFAGLEGCFDDTTFRHLKAVGIRRGWRCWEIGAGNGSVARWMAETVGERGAVLATDLNLDWVGPEIPPNVELRRHDVTTDAIPSSAYDLIHARLVLVHLPERGSIIPRLVEALAPGGWLVLEEFCAGFPNYPDPATDDEQAFARVFDVFRELLQRRGADTGSYPRTLPWRLQRLGLAHVGAEGRLVFGQGATAAATLMRANLRQTGALAVESGLVSVDDIAASLRLLDDPDCTFALPLMVSAWGQRGPR